MIFSVRKTEAGLSIEKYLKKNGFTAKEISRMKFTGKGILVNQKQSRVNTLLQEGDLLEIFPEERKEGYCKLVPKPLTVPILYEDDHLIALDKPAGIVVHPAGVHYSDTLSNQLAGYFVEKGMECPIRPVGRLDREVSGVVIFAKDQITAARLSRERERQEFTKEYYAWVEGLMPDQEYHMTLPVKEIGEGYASRVEMDGKSAETKVFVIARDDKQNITMVRCMIRHGRLHQIRVHLSALGYPILGDTLYGSRKQYDGRIALHAQRVTLYHPFSGAIIKIESRYKL